MAMKLAYSRVLLKISGEQLAGDGYMGFDQSVAAAVAAEVAKASATGAQIAVMVGGGNFVRGAAVAGGDVARITGDAMGMLATLMNAVALNDVFNAHNVPAAALTNLYADQVADPYTQRRALHHLAKGRVVIIGGGIGRPFLTTDTAAVSLALELECDVVCKITKVDGVYNKDPHKFDDATRLDSLTFQQAVEDPAVRVMDKAALGLAMENNKPIIVCDLQTPDNLRRIVLGEPVGTLVG